MSRLSREEQKARRELARACDDLFKGAMKVRKWGYLKPTAFKHLDQWFIDAGPVVWTDERSAKVQVHVKPYGLDDLTIRIMGGAGLASEPLSLLARGPQIIVRPMYSADIEDAAESAEGMVDRAVAFVDECLPKIARLTLADFVEFTRDDRAGRQLSLNTVASLILAERHEEARALIDVALAQGDQGRIQTFTADGRLKGFYEFAREWLDRRVR